MKNVFLIGDNIPINILDKLKESKIKYTLMDNIINLNGHELSVQAYNQIKKRDANNPHVIQFKKEILKLQIEKIKESDGVLVLNDINNDVLFQLSIATYLYKPIYLYNKLQFNDSNYNELLAAFGVIQLKGDLTKII